MRIGTALAFKDTTLEIQAGASDIKTPLVIFHGDSDLVTSHAASRRVWELASSPDKTFVTYTGGWHVRCKINGPFEQLPRQRHALL